MRAREGHWVAIDSLGYYGTDEPVDALAEFSRHENKEIRGAAVMALGYSKNPRALPVLQDRLKDFELARGDVVSRIAKSAIKSIGDG